LADVLTPAQRRKNMQRIRSKDTQPELLVRRLIHSLGFRYRLHARELPGRPDLVFRRRRKVIFVHGCYWHVHSCALGRVAPATNAEFWRSKRQGNVDRDARNLAALREAGWESLVIWQCELREVPSLTRRIRKFLGEQK
jgi:DNA mismatch endonuclease (patch repair protein)